MPYSDLQESDAYTSKHSGSAIGVFIYDENTPGAPIVGAATGINATDDFETIPIEEAGEDGVNEIVPGRHAGSMTVQAFWTPKRNDTLPTRQTFIGRKYTIMEKVAPGRTGSGAIVNVYVGCACSRVGQAHGARGAKTVDMAFTYERRYNGTEWATLTGA